MRLIYLPFRPEQAETEVHVDLPKGYGLQLLQLEDTDAARLEIKFGTEGIVTTGNWLDLWAGGMVIPYPPTSSMSMQADAHDLFAPRQSPFEPTGLHARILFGPDEATRAVLGVIERHDMADAWRFQSKPGFPQVQQEFILPEFGCPVNIPGAGAPADFDQKNVAVVPCRGFRSGWLTLHSAATEASYCVSLVELNTQPANPDTPLRAGMANMRLFAVPEPCQTHGARVHQIPFKLSGKGDVLRVRAWRESDAIAVSMPETRLRLSSSPIERGIKHTSSASLVTTGNATLYVTSLPANYLTSRSRLICWNRSALNQVDLVRIRHFSNMGIDSGMDMHVLRNVTSVGPIAAGAIGILAGGVREHDCAVAQLDQTASGAVSVSVDLVIDSL